MPYAFTQLDPQLRKRISRQKNPSAIIPVGSVEQHGPHLPITTDSEIVSEVSRRVGDRINALVLPTIYYGVSFEHAPFFQLSVRGPTLRRQLAEICESLSAGGIRTVFVINGHHGNQGAIRGIGGTARQTGVFEFSYWHFMERRFDHAGFAETSLMLAISRNVRMDLAEGGLDEDSFASKADLQRARRLASRSFPEATKNGIWGDPRGATRADGERLLSEITRNLSKRCQTCLTRQKTKLHQ